VLDSSRGLSESLDFVEVCWLKLTDGGACSVYFWLDSTKLMLNVFLPILNYYLILCTMSL
jgi:hypothetical protein